MARKPNKAERELIELALKRLAISENYAEDRYDTWMERIAFLRGFQFVETYSHAWADIDEPTGEERKVHNYVRAFVKSAVATRMRSFPNPEVPAATNDMHSMARASAAQSIIRSFIDDLTINPIEYAKLFTWSQTVGGGWMKHFWNPHGGRLVANSELYVEKEVEVETEDPETGEITKGVEIVVEPETDEFGEPIFENEFEGQIVSEFVDTVDGLPDPSAKCQEEMRYWIHRKERPIEELEELYEVDFFGKKTKGRFSSNTNYNVKDKDILSGDTDSAYAATKDDHAMIYEYWEPAHPARKNGALVIWSGDVIIYVGPNILKPARIPAVLYVGDNPAPNGLYADGIVEDLIPLQRSLNLIESKKIEYVRKGVNPHVLNPRGSMVDSDSFGEVIGQVIDYSPGLEPKMMNPASLPQTVSNMSPDLIGQMKEISTYSDISRGDAPQGIESGRAIAFLKENESAIREPDMMTHKVSCLLSLKHCFWLARQFMPEGRMLRTLGDEGWTYYELKHDELDYDVDLAPEAFSGGPNSRALRWSETMEAFEMGVFDDDRPGAKQVRRMLEMDTSARSTIDPNANHRNMARLENHQLLQLIETGEGRMNPVREFHDDYVHLEEHNARRNTPEYLEWPEEIQRMMDEHCEMHENQLNRKMAVYSQDQAMIGTPTSAPQPPGQPGVAPLDGGNPVGEPHPQPENDFINQEGFDTIQ